MEDQELNVRFNFNLTDEIFEGLELYSFVLSPLYSNLGILIMTEDFEMNSTYIVIRFYVLRKGPDGAFSIEDELQPLSFNSHESTQYFLESLPNMSALDLLVAMNQSSVKYSM
ncbi:hypothetical protein [Evansella tamaricis]|uniref:Uncharacterized protein n=1 Tax=Evansella tamaricis TaxID=2069301 RepID=A0ABS6JI48_9BACI|nr:hypothetical protein [Evansella tamaricis]MBU9713208.1 hypothetical protein [Evansella tamaricis]